MAGDWIKMRIWLKRDPKVIRMTDFLAGQREFMNWLTDPVQQSCKETAYEHVTSDVLRDVTVASLLETWGVTREQGRRENDDLIVDHCQLTALDEICGVPCFGEAMGFVEWAIEESYKAANGFDSERVRFPKFFKDHISPEEKHRTKHAERQARYRAKKGVTNDATRDVTVTHREEKRREDINNIPPINIIPPKTFQPPTIEEVTAYCQERKRGVDPERWFNFYAAKGWMVGKNRMKDWKAAVRTWEKEKEQEKDYQIWPEGRLF